MNLQRRRWGIIDTKPGFISRNRILWNTFIENVRTKEPWAYKETLLKWNQWKLGINMWAEPGEVLTDGFFFKPPRTIMLMIPPLLKFTATHKRRWFITVFTCTTAATWTKPIEFSPQPRALLFMIRSHLTFPYTFRSDVWLTVHRNSVWIRKTN